MIVIPRVRSVLLFMISSLSAFAVSALQFMHGCALASWWLQVPLIIASVFVLPAWIASATNVAQGLRRFALGMIALLITHLGFLEWLHSPLFPGCLLT